MGDAQQKQLFAGACQCHVQFPVNPYACLFRQVGELFQL